ncbi:MAG TPA: SagB/ThcOx family dehydrogenase [Kiritimatiellia bacterium]|nr:SagB/ThcOx family dehydrogenase [Kiritimatiellia bacterium]HSA19701.1 SagB/ThcOx family dehydrogenase [Kiritimatiellia bacterium]
MKSRSTYGALWMVFALAGNPGPAASQPTPVPPGVVELPPPRTSGRLSVEEALQQRRSIRQYAEKPLGLEQAGQLLWAAQGITRPEDGGRTAPSGGQLYPLTVYLAATRVLDLAPGVYRYEPSGHRLVPVMRNAVEELAQAGPNGAFLRKAAAVLVLVGDAQRAEARYGPGYRSYMDLEAGHASQNVYLQAVALGLGTVAANFFDATQVRRALRLPKGLEPLSIMPVGIPAAAGSGAAPD